MNTLQEAADCGIIDVESLQQLIYMKKKEKMLKGSQQGKSLTYMSDMQEKREGKLRNRMIPGEHTLPNSTQTVCR